MLNVSFLEKTQAKILKISKDTGRSDLLQSTNETMVQIMNAQLGISKEQLIQGVKKVNKIDKRRLLLLPCWHKVHR